jgi:HTH-type transcriptional regulator / antitoxin HigA
MMFAHKKYSYQPDYAVVPGETLKEIISALGMTSVDLARRSQLTQQSLNRIYKGEQPISYDTAIRLEYITGMPAKFWINLESNYRQNLLRIEERNRLQRDLELLDVVPVKELQKRGYVKTANDPIIVLQDILTFYGVSSYDSWREIWTSPRLAARRSACFDTAPGPASAWIRQGEIQAHNIQCAPYNRTKFLTVLDSLKPLTRAVPEIFVSQMVMQCAEAGVAVSFVREMKNVPWNGATKWLSPNKAMILLSLRGRGEDKFWLSFFHEAGHVVNSNKNTLYIADNSEDHEEQQADEFAAEMLIPKKINARIMNISTNAEIYEIADLLSVSPGIVAGRYQFLTGKWHYFKGLIRSFDWQS